MDKTPEEREVIKEYNKNDCIYKLRLCARLLDEVAELIRNPEIDPFIKKNNKTTKPGIVTITSNQ